MDGPAIHVEQGGREGPLLVLIHGLGATVGVWSPMLETAATRWPGRWLVLDLPGHGRSARLPRYAVADYASALRPVLDGADVLLGHSLGGVVAAALSSAVAPRAVFALGVKIDWTEEELARFHGLAAKPARRFEVEDEALRFHARLAGLEAEPGSPLLAGGARQVDDGWTAALDPAAFVVAAPDMARLARTAPCPVHLACGERDQMVGVGRLRDFDSKAIALPKAGHNAMVDRPDAVWDWVLSAL
jgi:pimeloyl-ACP methyl ester carboxylesterase